MWKTVLVPTISKYPELIFFSYRRNYNEFLNKDLSNLTSNMSRDNIFSEG